MFTEAFYSVTKEVKKIPIPIKREQYILTEEDGGNKTIMCQKLANIVLSSQL